VTRARRRSRAIAGAARRIASGIKLIIEACAAPDEEATEKRIALLEASLDRMRAQRDGERAMVEQYRAKHRAKRED